MARLIKGEDLNPEQRQLVLDRFIHRDTLENPWTDIARWHALRISVMTPSDSQWLRERAFYFTDDGRNLDDTHTESVPLRKLQERS